MPGVEGHGHRANAINKFRGQTQAKKDLDNIKEANGLLIDVTLLRTDTTLDQTARADVSEFRNPEQQRCLRQKASWERGQVLEQKTGGLYLLQLILSSMTMVTGLISAQ